ncbi:MAG: DUF4404 family protein [Gammaproteobacteria bacterium]|nr:DUF4404 family protein [Gammaproteobacteria bacterium]
MSQKDLHQLINKLRKELDRLETDSDAHQELSLLIINIVEQIEELGDKKNKVSLTENVKAQIEKFEVEHPRITSILNDVMMKLTNIGI